MTQSPTGAPRGHPVSYGRSVPWGQSSSYVDGVATPVAQAMTSSVPPPRRPADPPATDKLVRRTAATGSGWIAFVLFGGLGLLLLVPGLKMIAVDGDIRLGGVLILTGLLFLVPVLVVLTMRTEFDATGIHTRVMGFRRDIPWPRSRSGLFVRPPRVPPLVVIIAGLVLIVVALFAGDSVDNADVRMSAKAYVRDPQGRAIGLPGLSRRGLLRSTMERRGQAELDRIWAWAIARGYTQELGTPARS